MKKFSLALVAICGISVAFFTAVPAPVVHAADSGASTISTSQTQLDTLLRQVIALLLQEVAQLEAQLKAMNANSNSDANAGTSAPTSTIPATGATTSSVKIAFIPQEQYIQQSITLNAILKGISGSFNTQFLLDGKSLGPVLKNKTAYAWDSREASNGLHDFSVKVTDASGKTLAASTPISLRVSNAIGAVGVGNANTGGGGGSSSDTQTVSTSNPNENTPAPHISNVAVSTSPTTATIVWTTDGLSDTLVSYDVGGDGYAHDQGITDCGSVTASSSASAGCLGTGSFTGVTNHSFTITGLHPGTTYTFGLRSRGFTAGVPDPYKSTFYKYDPNSSICSEDCRFTTASAPADGDWDYWTSVEGPHHLTQGFSNYVQLEIGDLQGMGTGSPYPNVGDLTITVSGLPSGITVHSPDADAVTNSMSNISTNVFLAKMGWNIKLNTPLKFTAASNVAVGTYPIKITLTSSKGVPAPKTIFWSLTVDAATALAKGTPSSYPPIPCLNASSTQMNGSACSWNWTSNMVRYGTCWGVPGTGCSGGDNDNFGPGIDQGAWYYDGERVYFEIHDYDAANNITGDPDQWDTYAENWENVYAGYVSRNNGAINGYSVFPHGLYMGFLRNGTAGDSTDVNLLATRSAFASLMGSGVPTSDDIREDAYILNADRLAVDLGYATGPSYESPPGATLSTQTAKAVDLLLGIVDQDVVSQNADYVQPFMLGLAAESLTECYDDAQCSNYHDVRIPQAVKHIADWLWTNAWNKTNGPVSYPGAFYYNNNMYRYQGINGWEGSGWIGGSDITNLNLLIVPMYGWLYQYTGNSVYQREGDTIWQAGVNDDPGAGIGWSGKNFSQQYRWSFDYVNWRSGQ